MKLPSIVDVKKPCDTTYKADFHGGTRPLSDIKYVVLHSTESPNTKGSAQGVAKFFTTAKTGSANLVVDDRSCFLCLPDSVVPYAAPPLNTTGFHIEQCGYSAWSKAQWMLHLPTIYRAAYKASLRVQEHNIPPVWLTVADLKAGKKGITSHNNISLAFRESSHTDPGPNYPESTFMWFLRRFLAQGNV
jgi:hypothetical protein